jgi:hypothetical protein
MSPRLPAVAAAIALASCAPSGKMPDPEDFATRLTPRAEYVRERFSVIDPARASVRELALSVPTYNGAAGDGKTSPQGDSWILLGDASQAPVIAKVLTESGEEPVRLRLMRGSDAPEDPQIATAYELEKVTGGWKIISARKGPSSELLVWPMD